MAELASALSAWESFYVIVGSAAAVLVGLQFVVITLVAEIRPRTSEASVSAFGTPIIVHLSSALLIAAVMCAPWPSLGGPAIALTLCGLAGIVYVAIVTNRARRQAEYQPEWEDWLWHTILPGVVYAALAVAAPFLRGVTSVGLFIVGGAALGLLFIGIHNSWDTVTYIVLTRRGASSHERPASAPPPAPSAVPRAEPPPRP